MIDIHYKLFAVLLPKLLGALLSSLGAPLAPLSEKTSQRECLTGLDSSLDALFA